MAALRGEPETGGGLARLLRRRTVLLPIPVYIEILGGIGRQRDFWLQGDLATLKPQLPEVGTWRRMEEWCVRAAAAGQHFGLADLLIAALAAEVGAEVWSLDRAFERMEKLGFIQCFRLPA